MGNIRQTMPICGELCGHGHIDEGTMRRSKSCTPGCSIQQHEHKQKQRIFIDPGHGGRKLGVKTGDPNKVEPGDIIEKVVNLAYAKAIKHFLFKAGFDVELTRKTDVWITYTERMKRTKARDIWISVHFDSISKTKDKTGLVFYPNPETGVRKQSKRLARLLAKEFGFHEKYIWPDTDHSKGSVYIRWTHKDCHAVLLEVNTIDKAPNTKADRERVAKCVLVAIQKFLGI